ncbi:F-box protein At1g60400-like [Vicia villosa]|uniref:F-box protein At1g60400-like n=1 Tax=Vicia villosa TaxID=3911 RepID=UPI00273A769B|nr:F-box protein At1g60400-like [Vicia villosa]
MRRFKSVVFSDLSSSFIVQLLASATQTNNLACKVMSNSVTKKVKVTDDVQKDMLSDLPDCIILHILSFLRTKHAIRTGILSSRWKHLWKRLPALILWRSDFQCYNIFIEFMRKVLSLRDSSVSLHTLDFEDISHLLEPHILEWIVNYAISHNVQRLQFSITSVVEQIPLTLLSSQTLTHLNLSVCYECKSLFPKSLNLPALSTLELGNFTFYKDSEPFSTFSRLKSLLISDCNVEGAGTLCISSATLVNFTMHVESDLDNYYKIDLCTPSLSTFAFRGYPYQDISGSNISSLKHVDIDAGVFPYRLDGPPLFLFNWLPEFANIKSLTVTASTLQALSLVPELLEFKIPFMCKLKFLKVKIEEIEYELRMMLRDVKLLNVESKKEAARIQEAFNLGLEPSPLVPDEIVDFLLQNSPSAKVDLVDCRQKPLRRRL